MNDNRRDFLKKLGLGIGILGVTGIEAKAEEKKPEPFEKYNKTKEVDTNNIIVSCSGSF